MLYESATLGLQTRYGVAELRFRPSATWRGVLRDLSIALDYAGHPHLDLVVLRDFAELPNHSVAAEADGERHAHRLAQLGQKLADRLAAWQVPTIAHLDGPCRGAALELALACRWRTASGQIGTRFGAGDGVMCWGASVRLPRVIGRRSALAILAGTAVLTGGQAYALGLVDCIWPPRMAEVHLLALELALQDRPTHPSRVVRRLRRWRSGTLPAPAQAPRWLIRAVDAGLRFGPAAAFAIERAAARAATFAANQITLRCAA